MLETTRNLLQCAAVPYVEMQRSGSHGYYVLVSLDRDSGCGYECMGKMIVKDSFVRQHAMLRPLRARNPGRTVPHAVHIHPLMVIEFPDGATLPAPADRQLNQSHVALCSPINIPASCTLHAQHSRTYACSLNYSSSLVPFHSSSPIYRTAMATMIYFTWPPIHLTHL